MKIIAVILLLVGVILIGGALFVFNSGFIRGAIQYSEKKHAESESLYREAEAAKSPAEKERLMAEAREAAETANFLLKDANDRKLQPTLSAAGGALAIALGALLLFLNRRKRAALALETI